MKKPSEKWTLLDELRGASEEVKRWPKWMRVMHERCKEAERWFNQRGGHKYQR